MGRINTPDIVVESLLSWGLGTLRGLPWRTTKDPWHILVSEVMLQQTSVARVLPKFDDFIAHFPTSSSLAHGDLGEALRLWSGLGYPRRCRNLYHAAQHVEQYFDGVIPQTVDELVTLPGVGPYTARAVACFAYGQHVAVVDVNVARVLSRLTGTSLKMRPLQELANSLVPVDASWEWNQIVMDFGARQCVARSPKCNSCPLITHCQWRGSGVDPAIGSAGVSKPQARFAGSDRQARGRAMKAVIGGAVSLDEMLIAMKLEHDHERAHRLLEALVDEGLLGRQDTVFTMPLASQ